LDDGSLDLDPASDIAFDRNRLPARSPQLLHDRGAPPRVVVEAGNARTHCRKRARARRANAATGAGDQDALPLETEINHVSSRVYTADRSRSG
jgi:hypothetical protein